eukprot:COSAG01_NODE_240_length_20656_cov_53.398259_10_plen_122_part_00
MVHDRLRTGVLTVASNEDPATRPDLASEKRLLFLPRHLCEGSSVVAWGAAGAAGSQWRPRPCLAASLRPAALAAAVHQMPSVTSARISAVGSAFSTFGFIMRRSFQNSTAVLHVVCAGRND